jgi:hypothetical protein
MKSRRSPSARLAHATLFLREMSACHDDVRSRLLLLEGTPENALIRS